MSQLHFSSRLIFWQADQINRQIVSNYTQTVFHILTSTEGVIELHVLSQLVKLNIHQM